MYLKPINRQGKKRRKLKNVPTLSCYYDVHSFHIEEQIELPKSPDAQTDSKKDAA